MAIYVERKDKPTQAELEKLWDLAVEVDKNPREGYKANEMRRLVSNRLNTKGE